MKRERRTRDRDVRVVVQGWNELLAEDKAELMVNHPRLYFAVARMVRRWELGVR